MVEAHGAEKVDVMDEPVNLVEDRLFDGLVQLIQSLLSRFGPDRIAAFAPGHRPRPDSPGSVTR